MKDGSGTEFRYYYNSKGALARVEQYSTTVANGEVTSRTLVSTERYYYDATDRLIRVWETDAANNQHEFRWTYDSNDQVTELVETVNGQSFTYANSYNGDKQPTQSSYGSVLESFTYDGLGRLSRNTVSSGNSNVLTTDYTFRDLDSSRTTTQVSALQNSYGNQSESYAYTYDVKGNILSVSDGTHTITYEYDALNELTWEKNGVEGKAWKYTYDLGGNILSKTEYSYQNGTVGSTALSTVTYTYGDADWPDLLTAYNGSPITHDDIGNPLSYRGWLFTWQGGRQLATAEKGTTSLNFVYNESGLRTEKNVGNASHRYVYRGSTLVAEITGSYALYFHHDARGEIVGFTYASGNTQAEYFYRKNLQGDVIGIVDASGSSVAEYRYDAWGQVLSSSGTMAAINPIRYRGYYFDQETGLYYVSSRYYDPEIFRWINADDPSNLGANSDFASVNLFAYCGNNPVSRADNGGDWWHVVAGAAIGGLFELGSQLISNGGDFTSVNWEKVGIATLVGGATALCGPASGAIVSGLGNVAMECAGGTTDGKKIAASFAIGVGSSLIGYGAGKLTQKIGGTIAIKHLSKKTPGQIKAVINSTIDVAGRDRNAVKNIAWTLSQESYKHLPDALIGKTIPQIANSVITGFSGYGSMGAVYGFN